MNGHTSNRLSAIFWIGGAADAGKTSVTRALAFKHSLLAYHYDSNDERHHRRLAKHSPEYSAFLRESLDERWLEPTPERLASRAWQAFEDRFPFVIDDLMKLSQADGRPIIAEGFGLTPQLVFPLLTDRSHYVCLLPTKAFQLASMQQRGKGHFGGGVSNPERAAENLRTRDRIIADRLRKEMRSFGEDFIEVNERLSVDELALKIASRFRL